MLTNKEFYIDCDGIRVHAKLEFPKEQAEKMHLLVLIPGLTGHIEERHILGVKDTALACGYAVLRTELYGHGKSSGNFYDHTVLLWMQEAMRVIDYALNLPFCRDVILAGHSQGGLTTILAAGMMSDKIKAAMPMSPAVNIWDGACKGQFLDTRFEDGIPEYVTMGNGWKLSGNYIRAAAMLPVEEAIRKFQKPVFVIHGTDDASVPYSWAKWLEGKYADMRLVTIEGDDHCYNRHLDQVLPAVKQFLEEQKGKQ